MSDGFNKETLEGISRARTVSELEQYRGNPRLPWGGFHCGNYLYPALVDGTVTTLIWVVPPHVIGGETFVDGVRQETQNWLDLTLPEYDGLRGESGAVVGSLQGRKFVVCTAENFPALTDSERANLALDIDVDYFIRNSDDKVWQTPHQLFKLLELPRPKVLTVAYSVDGGYTPLKERYLGEVVQAVFEKGDASELRDETEAIVALDECAPEVLSEKIEELLLSVPDFLKPALLIRLERGREASELDPEYSPRFQNLVARHLIKKEYDKGLELMRESEEETPEALYLSSYLNLGKGDSLEAKRSLTKLLEHPELKELERSRVLILKANACLDLGEAKESLKLIEEALRLEPDSSEVYYLKANSHRATGRGKKAARAIRKALRLAKGRVSSLQMLLDAARIYDELGQPALAKSTRKELRESDVTGRYSIKTMLDEAKL
jgi:tetratricopeptide (TPR) repeat protein